MLVSILFLLFKIISSEIVYVRDFGIVNNDNSQQSASQNAISFYNAIKSASHGDVVMITKNETLYYVPSEEYIENINNINIVLDGKIILYNDLQSWQMVNDDKYFNAIDIRNSNNLTITGSGKIDGQGYIWWVEFYYGNIVRQRPTIINIKDCIDVTIENITLLNSPRFNIYADNVLRFMVRYMKIWVNVKQKKIVEKSQNPKLMFPFNTDGVDVKGKDIHIYNLSISNFDDSIAVKPSKGNGISLEGQVLKCSENILIENIDILYGAGLSIGSVPSSSNYCVKNVIYQNINVVNPLKLIYIKTENGGLYNATIKNITYRKINAVNPVLWPIYIGPQQQKEPDGTGEGFWPDTNPYVSINNILISNISVNNAKFQAGLFRCNISNPCRNITFENVLIKGKYIKNPYICDGNNSIYGYYNNGTYPIPSNCGFKKIEI